MPFINIPSSSSASWKDAVADPASLPASGNEVGDARVTESTSEIYLGRKRVAKYRRRSFCNYRPYK